MANESEQNRPTEVPKGKPKKTAANSRQPGLLPFVIAGIFCLTTAFALGTGAWWLFGKKLKPDVAQVVAESAPLTIVATPAPEATPEITPTPTVTPTPTPAGKLQPEQLLPPPTGTVAVTGGILEMGGQDANNPARKVPVSDFYIAETEVTNEQYAEFVVATQRKPPLTWLKGGVMPPTRGQYPVTGITFADANEFCQWLSKKLSLKARLPNEAEWEIAARGPQRFLFPWGNEWRKKAAVWTGNGGKLQPVKSIPEGRATCGAYDMAGNAWEWTSDNFLNEKGKPLLAGVKFKKIMKGGAAEESQGMISATSREQQVENGAHRLVGFRFVIELYKALPKESNADPAAPTPVAPTP